MTSLDELDRLWHFYELWNRLADRIAARAVAFHAFELRGRRDVMLRRAWRAQQRARMALARWAQAPREPGSTAARLLKGVY